MTHFVNLTPHDINVILDDGSVKTIQKSGKVARCAQTRDEFAVVDGVRLSHTSFGDVFDLPDQEDGTVFIVSAMVRNAVCNRSDVASPGDLVRDANGVVIGCNGLDCNKVDALVERQAMRRELIQMFGEASVERIRHEMLDEYDYLK